MIRFRRSQTYPIGVDVGHESVRMIQLERRGGAAGGDAALSVVAGARVPLPEKPGAGQGRRRSHIVAQVVAGALRNHPFRGRRIVVALPRELLSVRNLRVTASPGQSVADAVRAHDGSIEHFIAAGEVAGQQQQQQQLHEVIALTAKNGDAASFIQVLDAAGLEPAALDAEPCALYRTIGRFVRRREDQQDVHALVDVGHLGSRVIIGRGHEIRFVRSIPIGGRKFQEAVSRTLGIPAVEAQALRQRLGGGDREAVRHAACDATRAPMEELARQIELCLRYDCVTFRGQRPARLRLVGGEAADPQLLSILNRALPIPAQTMRPLYSVNTSRMPSINGTLCDWALALGLALRCVPEGAFGPRDGKPRLAGVAAEVALA
jgi:type IV pilus assembly protein PilM